MSDKNTTHFGYSTVAEDQKEGLVREIFDSVAPKYDLMNDLMSLGIHRLWKKTLINKLRPHRDMTLLDVGGGTGDVAFEFLKNGGGNVTVVDINKEMLDVGRDRALDQGILDNITWINGDAEKLPIEDHSVDAYTISFCIRNVTHIEAALREARRVLKPGGRFLCLEFSHVSLPGLKQIYDTYSFNVLPILGSQIAGDREAYQYLAESIRRFPDQKAFCEMITEAGLSQASYTNLSGGIAAIHSAWRI